MPRTNVSLEELMSVLNKSGASGGSQAQMQAQLPGLRQNLSESVYSQDTQIPDFKKQYMSKLQAIANMDRKLSGVYSDPSSPLYIERASRRDKAVSGASDVGYKELDYKTKQITSRKQELESIIDQALQLYKGITTEQGREEKADTKAYKASPEYQEEKMRTDLEKADKKKALKMQLVTEAANLTDKKAVEQFNELTAKEQEVYVNRVQSGEITDPGTQESIAQFRDEYRDTYKPKKSKNSLKQQIEDYFK